MFEQFWAVYPRRVGKGAAQKAWEKCVKGLKADPQAIIEGAKTYAAAKRGTDLQYVAHPGTWLNQQRWLDDPVQGVVEADGEYKVDQEALTFITQNKLARECRDRLMERTMSHHRARLEDAARRLGTDLSEMWDCMSHGHDGFVRRAWKAACDEIFHGKPAPQYLPIERSHWQSGKDRYESRVRYIRGPLELRASPPARQNIVHESSATEELHDDNLPF